MIPGVHTISPGATDLRIVDNSTRPAFVDHHLKPSLEAQTTVNLLLDPFSLIGQGTIDKQACWEHGNPEYVGLAEGQGC